MLEAQRIKLIEDFMKEKAPNFCHGPIAVVEKGPYENRQITNECTLQFSNRNDKEKAMRKIKNENLKLRAGQTDLKIVFTRSKLQKGRNFSLYKAKELIEQHSNALGKKVAIEWKMPTRKVTVDDCLVAFEQHKDHEEGLFLSPFQDLKIR